MFDRKVIKKRAKKILKTHYVILIVACMISGVLTAEFSDEFSKLSIQNGEKTTIKGSLPSELSASEVLKDIFHDNIEKGAEDAQKIEEDEISESDDPMFGRTRGVLAMVVNSLTSGSIYVFIASAINSIVGSESVTAIIMILMGFTILFMFWFYIRNTFAVVLRRIFLEARTYEKVPFERYMFLSHIKKWTKASFTMFVSYVYQTLWLFTIIGIFIKHYSYFLVPYIVAENPDIKANEAITLSRKMMDGHKWECFKIDLSFIGWYVLSGLTFGLSALFFSNPYRMSTFAEYYEVLRSEAKQKAIAKIELLNDKYLFERPSKELLLKIYPEAEDENVKEPVLSGIQGFFAKWFGILFKEGEKEKAYEGDMYRAHRYQTIEDVVLAKTYPRRLYPIAEKDKRNVFRSLDPLRAYTIWSIILMFFIFSMIGWIWEVSLHLISDGVFVNRGAMHGPWLPIYGSGGILILLLLKRFRDKPFINFFLILVVCGILEYTTSLVMEINTGLKWWDYSGYFLNLNGRICAEGLLVFGIGGMAFVYILAPVFDNIIRKISPLVTKVLCTILVIAFIVDMIYSHFYPNTGEGITSVADISDIKDQKMQVL